MSTRILFTVRKDPTAKPAKRWQAVRVGDHTVMSAHRTRGAAILAAGMLLRDGADPGPELSIQALDRR